MHLFKKPDGYEDIYKTFKVKVSGMHCEGCSQLIQKSLSKIGGVRKVQIDFKNEVVRMELDEDKLNLEKIRRVIRKIGFMPGFEQIGNQ